MFGSWVWVIAIHASSVVADDRLPERSSGARATAPWNQAACWPAASDESRVGRRGLRESIGLQRSRSSEGAIAATTHGPGLAPLALVEVASGVGQHPGNGKCFEDQRSVSPIDRPGRGQDARVVP